MPSASSGLHRYVAIKIPLACSTTVWVASKSVGESSGLGGTGLDTTGHLQGGPLEAATLGVAGGVSQPRKGRGWLNNRHA
jgi:hypothetical protein